MVTPMATQLAKMASRMKISKGLKIEVKVNKRFFKYLDKPDRLAPETVLFI